MSNRRLPVYVLADCSGSMMGDPIESVKNGLRMLHANLLGDPSAVESAYLSIITFNSTAQQIIPLTEVAAFNPPDLAAGGTTSLGGALRILSDCLASEVRKNTGEIKGDWKPLVFILTDGAPTDNWSPYADQIKHAKPSPANIIAVACGTDADPVPLKQITDTVLIMRDMSAESFKQFFKWVSASVAQTSASIGQSPEAAVGGVALPPPPPVITIIP
jgi:uncharacterized protein YegL